MNLFAFGLCLALAGVTQANAGALADGNQGGGREVGARRLSLEQATLDEALRDIESAAGVRIRIADEGLLGRSVSVNASYRTVFEGLERALTAADCPSFAARRQGDDLALETFCGDGSAGAARSRPTAGRGQPLTLGESPALPRFGPDDAPAGRRVAQAGDKAPTAPLPGGGPYDPAEINKRSAAATERFSDLRKPLPFSSAEESAPPVPAGTRTAPAQETPGLPPMTRNVQPR